MDKQAIYGWSDAIPHTADYLTGAVMKVARNSNAKTVLDAGCGNGALAARLAADGFDVIGVDGDEGGIEVARASFPGLRFEVGRFENSPPGAFDLVVSTEVIEHLYAPHELARYCFDALKPGGTLAISTPYHGYLKNLAFGILGTWDRHFTVDWHGGHIKFWSRATLTTLLEKQGFRVTGFIGVGRLPWLWKSMILVAEKPAA
jgi:2-polyprenyl-3-methyl-5-hydroxy-6-metoxy-1,4-benzoquinol methylase